MLAEEIEFQSAKSRVFDSHGKIGTVLRGRRSFNPLRVASSIPTSPRATTPTVHLPFQSAKSRVFDSHGKWQRYGHQRLSVSIR